MAEFWLDYFTRVEYDAMHCCSTEFSQWLIIIMVMTMVMMAKLMTMTYIMAMSEIRMMIVLL